MNQNTSPIEIYQLRIVLRETSPHIWRRVLVPLSAERPIVLFDLTTARLAERKILLPGVTARPWHPQRRIAQTPSWPRTPVARVCRTERRAVQHPRRSIPPVPSDWLPPPKVRSPLIALDPIGGLPRHRQTRGNTGLHRHSLLCRDNAHWCHDLPSNVRVAYDHNAHTGEAPPEGLARHGSRPSIRRLASSLNCAGSSVDSLRKWPSQYNPRDDPE